MVQISPPNSSLHASSLTALTVSPSPHFSLPLIYSWHHHSLLSPFPPSSPSPLSLTHFYFPTSSPSPFTIAHRFLPSRSAIHYPSLPLRCVLRAGLWRSTAAPATPTRSSDWQSRAATASEYRPSVMLGRVLSLTHTPSAPPSPYPQPSKVKW